MTESYSMLSSYPFNSVDELASSAIINGSYDLQGTDMIFEDDYLYMGLGINDFIAHQTPSQSNYMQQTQPSQSQQQFQQQQQHQTIHYTVPQWQMPTVSYQYQTTQNDVFSDYSSIEDFATGSSTTSMTPSEFHAEVHKLELSIQQPLQLQSQLQLQPQYKTVDLFPPATACTPQPNHRNVLPNNYISRRESLESEFDYKTMLPEASGSNLDYSEYNELVDETIDLDEDNEEADDEENDESSSSYNIMSADDNEEDGDKFDFQDIHSGSAKRYSVMRGVSSGGSATKPPQGERNQGDFEFIKCKLTILDADESSICKPEWSNAEKEDKRRIIRIERRQREHEIITSFQIVGAAESNPEPKASQPGVDVIEVSCLECLYSDDFSEDDDSHIVSEKNDESFLKKQHYITSVEVVKIVELLIGTQNPNLKERRKERGRIRSNLVPFWSKKPISSKKTTSGSSPSFSPAVSDNAKTNADFRNELAQRIMGYEIRKPRGFDKEVRILEWEKLVPALQRALQSYYVKIPTCDLN